MKHRMIGIFRAALFGSVIALVTFLAGCSGNGGNTQAGPLTGTYWGTMGDQVFIFALVEHSMPSLTTQGSEYAEVQGGCVLKDTDGKIIELGRVRASFVDANTLHFQCTDYQLPLRGTVIIERDNQGDVIALRSDDMENTGAPTSEWQPGPMRASRCGDNGYTGDYNIPFSGDTFVAGAPQDLSMQGDGYIDNYMSGHLSTYFYHDGCRCVMIGNRLYIKTGWDHDREVPPSPHRWSGAFEGAAVEKDEVTTVHGAFYSRNGMQPLNGNFTMATERL